MIGLIVFGCLFLVGVIITIIVMIAKYVEDGYCEYGTYIKYKTFKSFYNINPERWYTHDDYVTYSLPRKYCNSTVYLYFNFIDYYRYRYWLYDREHCENKQQHSEKLRMIAESVQKDIQDNEKQCDAGTQDAIKEILGTKTLDEEVLKQLDTKQND